MAPNVPVDRVVFAAGGFTQQRNWQTASTALVATAYIQKQTTTVRHQTAALGHLTRRCQCFYGPGGVQNLGFLQRSVAHNGRRELGWWDDGSLVQPRTAPLTNQKLKVLQ